MAATSMIFQTLGATGAPTFRSLLGGVSGCRVPQNLTVFLPVIGLLISLCLQVILLITGKLRKWTASASKLGWVAYVFSDLIAAVLLGLLTRTEAHAGLYGLWSAFLIYHLGGPDNFTAYERADSELWMRHLTNLVVHVATATYIIGVNTKSWLLLPTLLVFFVGVARYWERNAALRLSSRGGINKYVKVIYSYMQYESTFAHIDPVNSSLEYLVAGEKHWMTELDSDGRRCEWFNSKLVTTGDVERELNLSSDPALTDWACLLSVASASSKAYLRRLVSLARIEQYENSSTLRTIWFEQRIGRAKWLYYMQIEQEFLYNFLYTKPTEPDGHVIQLMLRVFSSVILVGALFLVYFYAHERTWLGHPSYKVATYIVLAVGLVVEISYVLRLLLSKGAVVATLVILVRTRRAAQRAAQRCVWSQKFYKFKLVVNRLTCVGGLYITKFLEPSHKTRLYIPRSRFSCGGPISVRQRSLLRKIGISLSNSERGWEMLRLTFAEGIDHEERIRKIQECQGDAVNAILDLVYMITETHSNRLSNPAKVPSPIPEHSKACHTFNPFYNSDWEHVLLIWWTATLKLLHIERSSLTAPRSLENVEVESMRQSQTELREIKVEIPGLERNKGIWAMLYVCRLLTVCPELLPTQLDFTKELVASVLDEAEQDIQHTDWVTETKAEVAGCDFDNQQLLQTISSDDCNRASRLLAVMLYEMGDAARWEVVGTSACWFIACLAQSNKIDEHCARLANGGELLTLLWTLSSHLGGGVQ